MRYVMDERAEPTGSLIMEITLNLPYDLKPEQWLAVDTVFQGMDGWIGANESDNTPQWYGREGQERYIWASVEPSGLLVVGNLDPEHWTAWVSVLCARLS